MMDRDFEYTLNGTDISKYEGWFFIERLYRLIPCNCELPHDKFILFAHKQDKYTWGYPILQLIKECGFDTTYLDYICYHYRATQIYDQNFAVVAMREFAVCGDYECCGAGYEFLVWKPAIDKNLARVVQ